jgi:hypothetical protein
MDQQDQEGYELINGNDEGLFSLQSSPYLGIGREARDDRNLETGTVYQVHALGTGTVHLGRGGGGLRRKTRAEEVEVLLKASSEVQFLGFTVLEDLKKRPAIIGTVSDDDFTTQARRQVGDAPIDSGVRSRCGVPTKPDYLAGVNGMPEDFIRSQAVGKRMSEAYFPLVFGFHHEALELDDCPEIEEGPGLGAVGPTHLDVAGTRRGCQKGIGPTR